MRGCAYGADGGGSGRTNLAPIDDIGAVTLTEDPFTDAPNGDFSLNSAEGGGALLRAAGLNPYDQLGYVDIGAVQSQNIGVGGGSGVVGFSTGTDIQEINLGETAYFHFGINDADGSGADGVSAAWDVRLAGASASAVPVMSGSATLITGSGFPAGCYEVAFEASTANGFAVEEEYAVFATLAVDSQNPTGYVGSFRIVSEVGPVTAFFTNRTTNGFSSVETISGEYILHVDGDFAGATLTLWGGEVGQDPTEFVNLREFQADQKRKFTYAGDIRFEVSGATGSTSITTRIQKLV
jgi:hypothetical protein